MRHSTLICLVLAGCGATPRKEPPKDLSTGDLTLVYDFSSADDAAPPDAALPDDLPPASDLTAPPVEGGPPIDLHQPPVEAGPGADLTAIPMPDLAAPHDLAGADLACDSAKCTQPPPTACDGNGVRSYSGPGACMSGACTYPSKLTSCTFGCYNAQCAPSAFSFIGNTSAFVSGTANAVALFGGNAPAGKTVSGVTQTYPHGTVKSVHLVFTLDDFTKTKTDLTMQADPPMGNNDQWYAIIPAQSQGAHVKWYVRADLWDGTSQYDSGNGKNFDYTVN